MKIRLTRFISLLCIAIIMISMTDMHSFGISEIRAASRTKLKKTKITLKEGKKYQVILKNKTKKGKYTYQSSNKKVAKVNKKGKVTAIKKGMAKITVRQIVGKTKLKVGTLKVTVKGKKAVNANKPDNPTVSPITPLSEVNVTTPTPKPLINYGSTFFKGDLFDLTFQVVEKWDEAYNATVTIKNTSDKHIDDWAVFFYSEDEITNLWNGKILKWEDGIYLVDNAVWNQDIPVNGSVSFGFTAKYENKPTVPRSFCLSNHRVVVDETDYKVDFKLYSDWGDGFNAGMTITNLTDEVIEDWSLEFDFDREFDNIWSTVVVGKSGSRYELKNPGWEQNVEVNRPVIFGFTGYPGGITEFPENYVLKKYGNDVDYDLDRDGDGLTDVAEVILGTNPYLTDTDGDGLNDYIEVANLGLDPMKPDTDENGVKDGDEDTDEDGLINLKELEIGIEPWNPDTDVDGLLDGEEVNKYKTDPLNSDTDEDGLEDGDEILLGFNPLKPDTDDNGILDPDEKVRQSMKEEINEEEKPEIVAVTVEMNVNGNIQKHLEIESVYDVDEMSSEVEGLVGAPVEITTEEDFDQATITFHYDPTKLGTTDVEDLAVMWYDEDNNDYEIFEEESVLDKNRNTISYTTTHFSTYMVVNKKVWYETWRREIDYARNSNNTRYLDTVFTIDASGSMKGAEIKYTKQAISNFIDAMYNSDRACVVTFTDEAEVLKNFTSNKDTLKDIVNNIEAGGHTDSDKGLKKAIKQFTKDSYKPGNDKVVILICDGDVEYNAEIVELANDNNVKIYTLLVGDDTDNERDMKKIASETGGKYYYVDSAERIGGGMGRIQDDTLGSINTKDTDGDGLYDVFETSGMRCPNGKVMYSNQTKKNTDGDGLTDDYEMGVDRSLKFGKPYKVKKLKIKKTGEVLTAIYFDYRSNPSKADTDNDGLRDDADPKPRKKSKHFVLDTSLDTIPTSNKMDNDIEDAKNDREEDMKKDRSRKEKDELIDIWMRAVMQSITFGKIDAGKFMKHFLDSSGEDYVVSSYDVKKRMRGLAFKTHARVNMEKNMKKFLRACKEMVADGETIYIRTSPKKQFTFADYTKGLSVVTNLHNFASLGVAEAGIVAKCSNINGKYKVTVRYYLLDYYDWQEANDVIIFNVSASELYKLNAAGLAQNFRIRGYMEETIEFEKNSKLKDVTKKIFK